MVFYVSHSCRERLEEDGTFPKKELAALLVSKVYFHLGSYLDSLTYALRSGPMLHQDPNQLYIDTIKGRWWWFRLYSNNNDLYKHRIYKAIK